MRGVRASGQGEAANACRVQSVPLHAYLGGEKSTSLCAASLRSSGLGVRKGLKANGPKSVPGCDYCAC